MIIFWNGRGWLVVMAVATFGTLFTQVTNARLGDGYCDRFHWPFGTSLIVSGIVCWFLGKFFMSRPHPLKINQPTGKEIVVMGTNDRLFFIPMHLWGPILATIGVLVCLIDFLPKE